jgi:hypothetical protein
VAATTRITVELTEDQAEAAGLPPGHSYQVTGMLLDTEGESVELPLVAARHPGAGHRRLQLAVLRRHRSGAHHAPPAVRASQSCSREGARSESYRDCNHKVPQL